MSWLTDFLKYYAEGEAAKQFGFDWREKTNHLKAATANLGLEGDRIVAATRNTNLEADKRAQDIETIQAVNKYFAGQPGGTEIAAKYLQDKARADAEIGRTDVLNRETEARTAGLPSAEAAAAQDRANLELTRAHTGYYNRQDPYGEGTHGGDNGDNLGIGAQFLTLPGGQVVRASPRSGRVLPVEGITAGAQTISGSGNAYAKSERDMEKFDAAANTFDRLERSLSRVKNSSLLSDPVEKLFAIGELKSVAQGLGGIAAGRAAGEVGVFTNQDRAVYAGTILPNLMAVAAGKWGEDEARHRLDEAWGWLEGVRQRAAQRFQDRYGNIPESLQRPLRDEQKTPANVGRFTVVEEVR